MHPFWISLNNSLTEILSQANYSFLESMRPEKYVGFSYPTMMSIILPGERECGHATFPHGKATREQVQLAIVFLEYADPIEIPGHVASILKWSQISIVVTQ